MKKLAIVTIILGIGNAALTLYDILDRRSRILVLRDWVARNAGWYYKSSGQDAYTVWWWRSLRD